MNKIDIIGKTKQERIDTMTGEILAHTDDDKRIMLRSIVEHHIGVLWETIEKNG